MPDEKFIAQRRVSTGQRHRFLLFLMSFCASSSRMRTLSDQRVNLVFHERSATPDIE